ncbi:MAG: GDP-mannose 4,6-dehydratase, partial [Thermoplasmata archaeon]
APEYCDLMWRMLQAPTPGDFVGATGETHSVEEFVAAAFHHAGIDDWKPYVELDSRYVRPAEVDLLCGDPKKAKEKLGWAPMVRFSELVGIMVDSDLAQLRAHPTPQHSGGMVRPARKKSAPP